LKKTAPQYNKKLIKITELEEHSDRCLSAARLNNHYNVIR